MDRRNQTEKLLNAAMDHLAATLEQPTDPRAWDHLLVYCPRDVIDRHKERLCSNRISLSGAWRDSLNTVG